MFQPLNAKVESPNYNFSVELLQDFFPGKKFEAAETKHGKAELMSDRAGIQTKKIYVAHLRYRFPVIVQIREGLILDSFSRLPSYFLHDIFLQSLVNRMGKQTSYKRTGEEAYYVWTDKDFRHIYSAACTITCFPIFYAVEPVSADHRTLLRQMTP